MRIKHIHCPVNGWDCPHYRSYGHFSVCILENPLENCDDFASFWDEDDDYVDNDWSDENDERVSHFICNM